MIIAVSGIALSAYSAHSEASTDSAALRDTFRRDALEVTGRIDKALEQEAYLVVDTGAYLAANTDGTQVDFNDWLAGAHVREQYPQVFGLGFVVVVPHDELSTFSGLVAAADGSLVAGHVGEILPVGARDQYCLVKLAFTTDIVVTPPDFDYCADGTVDLATASTATTTYFAREVAGDEMVTVLVPIYQNRTATGAPDITTFLGWVGAGSFPHVVLDAALAGHDDLGVSMRIENTSPDLTVSSGPQHDGDWSNVVDLGNGRVVTVAGTRRDTSIFGNWAAVMLLFLGSALSVMVGAFILILGTGRGRALRVIETRTDELRHQALHDPLTGLPNRTLITDHIDRLLVRNRRQGTGAAALYLDLDDFKDINDTLGHAVGDRLLVAVASRLTATVRDVDMIGRMGGDEFVILIDGSTYGATAELVARRVLDVMREPFAIGGLANPLQVRASIGVAVGDRETGYELLRDADVALYHAKANGKDRHSLFREVMQTSVLYRVQLEADLRTAVDLEQFTLAYQPIYRLDDLVPSGAEALLRWTHPTLGNIGPDEFVPILEQTGLIRPVGRWILQTACAQMAIWNQLGSCLEISVNVSGRQLDDESIVGDVRAALDASGLDPCSLVIEVTETALVDNVTLAANTLEKIRALGVGIAVDDFGTGYSSLAQLQQLPVDRLKIDRSFISAVQKSPQSRALIRSIVRIGRDLGLTTIAEGVELPEELDHCRREGVDHVQGFLLSRPLDAASFEAQILPPESTSVGMPTTAPPSR